MVVPDLVPIFITSRILRIYLSISMSIMVLLLVTILYENIRKCIRRGWEKRGMKIFPISNRRHIPSIYLTAYSQKHSATVLFMYSFIISVPSPYYVQIIEQFCVIKALE